MNSAHTHNKQPTIAMRSPNCCAQIFEIHLKDRGRIAVPIGVAATISTVGRVDQFGSIPNDNPFFNEKSEIKKAIFSFGHRNPQGMIIHPESDEIWLHEHGPKGGDEINIVESGENYGWPKITYGVNYSGTTITENTSMPGLKQPFYYWVPSIAPSGMAFSTSGIYEKWKGNLFVGSLKYRYLERLVINNKKVVEREKILENVGRVRDVREGPDGYLYIAVEGKGILKIVQKK